MPPAKRAKADRVEVPYQKPVPEEFYLVPMETIDKYQKLQAAFLSRTIAPLCLLYGPRQFGKTTIGHRLRTLLAAVPSIRAIYMSLTPSDVKTEEDFWLALSITVGEETRSSKEFDIIFSRHKKSLWLAIDEMDNMFQNEELTSNFMETLRGWQPRKYFLGFLGLGSHDLLNMHMKLKGGSSASPFNLGEVFQAKPFSKKQMKGYFKQIQARYPFRKSTRQAIMAY
ncbi:hypothetical protein PHYSODRAFT_322409 [Phytophthora sojae]|uniref:AAA+ ATPase domain-containing protein n=1 Tax=Phytophthora sojae (strain P6497) TaxID=1094619 RepID=G4YIW1_PHYSP|nr:hypothetical protein PHYSODRAFT_322409 [Phytophthora sojae]EGZ28784.1 hypothetical protein PHYSODRAFT_322409 [Phytophthora sojae]|eukprot:XP_009516059.1 hypothetical protein PHYSODRAFT_322409 [Phytophthora sojae]